MLSSLKGTSIISPNTSTASNHICGVNNQMKNIHKLARQKIPASIKMYNVGVKTHLPIYPLVELDALIKKNKVIFRNGEFEKIKKEWEKLYGTI